MVWPGNHPQMALNTMVYRYPWSMFIQPETIYSFKGYLVLHLSTRVSYIRLKMDQPMQPICKVCSTTNDLCMCGLEWQFIMKLQRKNLQSIFLIQFLRFLSSDLSPLRLEWFSCCKSQEKYTQRLDRGLKAPFVRWVNEFRSSSMTWSRPAWVTWIDLKWVWDLLRSIGI